jgi:cell division control protein 24
MQECSQRKVISPETIRYLFANLHSLVDFQRRFLIGLEANAILPPEDQRIGALFLSMEEGFACYEPFCANYNTASDIALRETPNLQALAHIVEPTYGLPSLLIKPIQRICKYPLLMKSLIQYTKEEEYPYYSELLDAMAAIERVAGKVNEIKRKEENLEVVKSFSKKTVNITDEIVDTWGELLQHDRFEVITKDQKPREMFVYLFKEVLVCSRDVSDKGKKRKDSTHSGKKIEETLEIRGQINMSSVMKVLEKTSDSGDLFIRLFWKEEEVQILIIKCRNEEQRSKWITNLQDIISEKKLLKQQSLKAEAEHLKSIAPLPAPPTLFNDDEVPHVRRSHGNYSHGLKGIDSPTPLSPQHLQFRNRSASSPNIHPARTPNPTSSPLAQNGREFSNQLPVHSSRPSSNDNVLEQYHQEPSRNGSSYNNGGDSGLPNGKSSHSNGHSNGSVKPSIRPQIKLKINYLDDVFVIMVPSDIQYPDLLVRVERKIRLCGGRRGQTYPTPDIEDGFRLRYKDEDDDPITINSQEDVHMAFESASQSQSGHPATNPSLQFPSVTLYVD